MELVVVDLVEGMVVLALLRRGAVRSSVREGERFGGSAELRGGEVGRGGRGEG